MQAIWNNQVIADSFDTVVVDNNHYFPENSINKAFFKPSTMTSVCSWKGQANYYSLEVNGEVNPDAAWYYPNCSEKAKHIEGYVAFWKGVTVTD